MTLILKSLLLVEATCYNVKAIMLLCLKHHNYISFINTTVQQNLAV